MSTTPTRDGLKSKAKVIRKFLIDKYGVDVSHGHCLDLASDLFELKNWNTASAVSRTRARQISLPTDIRTVGQMRRALEPYKDSDIIDAEFIFNIGDFLESLDPMERPEDSIRQEFSFVLERLDDGPAEPRIASFKLVLENSYLEIAPYTEPPKESCGFYNASDFDPPPIDHDPFGIE